MSEKLKFILFILFNYKKKIFKFLYNFTQRFIFINLGKTKVLHLYR